MLDPESKPPMTIRRFAAVYLGTVVLLVVFSSGLFLGSRNLTGIAAVVDVGLGSDVLERSAASVPKRLRDKIDFKQFWTVWDLVQERFIDRPVSESQLFYGALSGIVGSLNDPYSVYLDPTTAKKFNDDLAGSFDGIGAEIGIKRDELRIIAPLEGSPAERAGLKSGDIITAIGDVETRGMPLEKAISLIRGKKGTSIVLKIFRESFVKPKEFTVVRDTIVVQSVKSKMLPNGIAYLKISSFDERATAEVRRAVDNLLQFPPKAFIVDLRNDPGGFLDTAVEIAGEWLSREPVVYEQYHAKPRETNGLDSNGRKVYNATGSARLAKLKTVVLVNGGSASASEILAGALQDYGKAILVGTRTFGKGSVQEYETLSDGSAVKVTVARWLTPKGRAIEKEGIVPDIEVPEPEGEQTQPEAEKKDLVLEKAVEIILTGK